MNTIIKQITFARDLTSHIEAVRNLSTGVRDMTAAIHKLKGAQK